MFVSDAHRAHQGHVPGTDRWESIDESSDATEDVPGVLIVRIRENLDFGMFRLDLGIFTHPNPISLQQILLKSKVR
jgi:hypothetical protein